MKRFHISRKTFLINLILFIITIFIGILKFLSFSNKKGSLIISINIEDLRKGVNHFSEYGVIILNFEKLVVLSDACTHLGCKVKFNSNKEIFQCPCHGSIFSIYGKVLKGPAKKDLKKLKYKIKNNKIKIIV